MSRNIASHDYGPKRFKWLTLKLIEWQDPSGRTRSWESCERTTRAASGVDAVAIVVKAISTSSPPQIFLVSQYRPPLASICLELPAGLIDKGESAEDAAFRELHEETGLTPHRLISVSPVCCSDPGMTNTNMQVAVVEVDLDAPINRNTKQNLDDGECIDIEMAPWDGLLPWLIQRKRELGCQIDARLMSFAQGLDLGMKSTGSISSSDDGADNGIAAVPQPGQGASRMTPGIAGGAPKVAVGVAVMAEKGVSATRASSSVISDGEDGER